MTHHSAPHVKPAHSTAPPEPETHQDPDCKVLHPVDGDGKRDHSVMVCATSGRRIRLTCPCGKPIQLV